MSSNGSEIRDRIAQNEVTVMRSYLEVNVAEWFSDREVPFGYEAFVIPSVVGPGKEEWETMTNAIRAIGRGNEQRYRNLVDGTRFDNFSAFEVLDMWNEIYDKHRLQEEQITVPVREALEGFSKTLILPDFTIYMDFDGKLAPEGFDWSSYDYIVEVSGLWGVGLPGEATESDWWDWYRVSAVAFKELVYKLLELWDDVYWVVPFQPHIPGVSDGIPKPIREDEHYIIANMTADDMGMDRLADKIGITTEGLEWKLSPPIEPVEYNRPKQGGESELSKVEYTWEGIDMQAINNNENAVAVSENMLVYHGDMGEVYVTDSSAHVMESQWREFNMIMLREYVLDSLSKLHEDGIVVGLSKENN